MISFSPKARFLKNAEQADAFRKLVHEPLIHSVIESALAEMSYICLPESQSQLIGVKNFITIFLNMAEPLSVSKPLPPKELKSWDVPEPKPEPSTKET